MLAAGRRGDAAGAWAAEDAPELPAQQLARRRPRDASASCCTCACGRALQRRLLRGCPPLLFVLYCLNSFIESFPLTAYGEWLNEEIRMPLDMQSRFYACIFLPWCLKPLYGWVSVNYPIRGQGKRPYIIICSLGSAAMYIVTATLVETYTSAFLVTTLRAICNAFAELLLSLILVDYAVTPSDCDDDDGPGVGESAPPTAVPGETPSRTAAPQAATASKIGLLQAVATGARNVGTLASLLVGLVLYRCGTYEGISARLIIGGTAAFSVVAAVCAFFLRDGAPPAAVAAAAAAEKAAAAAAAADTSAGGAGPDPAAAAAEAAADREQAQRGCCRRRRRPCRCTRKGTVSLSLFLLLQLLVVVTILRSTAQDDDGSDSSFAPSSAPAGGGSGGSSNGTTAASSVTATAFVSTVNASTTAAATTTTTAPPVFSPALVEALTASFWALLGLMLLLVSVEVGAAVHRRHCRGDRGKGGDKAADTPCGSRGRRELAHVVSDESCAAAAAATAATTWESNAGAKLDSPLLGNSRADVASHQAASARAGEGDMVAVTVTEPLRSTTAAAAAAVATAAPFWQSKHFLVAAAFIFCSNAMPTASTQWYSFQYANFPTQPCEVQYISVIGSAASVLASVLFARYLVRCPTLPMILALASLAAAVSMLRLPLVTYLLGGGAAPDANATGVSNAGTFALFAGYSFVGQLSSELATVAVLVFATEMVPGGSRATTPAAAGTATTAAPDGAAAAAAATTAAAAAAESEAVRNRGLYYAVFLSFLDVGDSVSDWATAPIVNLLGLAWDNFASLGYLLDLEGACALLPLVFIPILMSLRRHRSGAADMADNNNGGGDDDDDTHRTAVGAGPDPDLVQARVGDSVVACAQARVN